jgi:hypothetical protein
MHKARSIQKLFVEIGVEELGWPAQNPDLNPIGMNWNAKCEPSVIAQHQCPTSLMLSMVAEWKQVSAAMWKWEDFPEEWRLL